MKTCGTDLFCLCNFINFLLIDVYIQDNLYWGIQCWREKQSLSKRKVKFSFEIREINVNIGDQNVFYFSFVSPFCLNTFTCLLVFFCFCVFFFDSQYYPFQSHRAICAYCGSVFRSESNTWTTNFWMSRLVRVTARISVRVWGKDETCLKETLEISSTSSSEKQISSTVLLLF